MPYRIVVTLSLLALTATLAAAQDNPPKGGKAQDAPSPVTESKGPAPTGSYGRFLVGDSAPDIDLHDQDERRFHLSDARRERPWLIVFARQPEDLREVERAREDVQSLGVGLVAIAPFRRARLMPMIPNPRVRLLTDGPSWTARIYGAYDPVTSNPRPAVFLVDRAGHILWLMSGGIPTSTDLARLSREALEQAGQRTSEGQPALH
jgi:peroxiredoxin